MQQARTREECVQQMKSDKELIALLKRFLFVLCTEKPADPVKFGLDFFGQEKDKEAEVRKAKMLQKQRELELEMEMARQKQQEEAALAQQEADAVATAAAAAAVDVKQDEDKVVPPQVSVEQGKEPLVVVEAERGGAVAEASAV